MSPAVNLQDIRKQIELLQVAERFFDSVTLFALFETGVFRALAGGPKSFAQIRRAVGGNAESLRATLDAAVALKILSRVGESYSASETVLDCLAREDSPAYLGEWIAFLHSLVAPLAHLDDAIRSGSTPGAIVEDLSGDTEAARRMTAAMDAYARSRGTEIAERLDFSKVTRLLDLGCGPGTYSLAIVERHPHVRATLLDFPGPIAEARRLAAARGMERRVKFVAGDGMSYVPKEPFDAILVSNTLHMIGPEGSMRLLERCHGMLAPGGRLIVQAQYLNDDRVSPRWPTLLSLIQRVVTSDGRNHAIRETTRWMERAGFHDVRHVPFSLWNVCSCLVGRRPLRERTRRRPAAAAGRRRATTSAD